MAKVIRSITVRETIDFGGWTMNAQTVLYLMDDGTVRWKLE